MLKHSTHLHGELLPALLLIALPYAATVLLALQLRCRADRATVGTDRATSPKHVFEVLECRGWTGNQIENRYSHWIWRQYASAFWDDIRIGRVLPFRDAKDENDERHVHPLQLDVIDRVLTLWSNLGETVLTPFMGVGSEVWSAVRNGRKAIGVELKPSYYRQSVRNMEAIDLPESEQVPFEFAIDAPLDEELKIA